MGSNTNPVSSFIGMSGLLN